MGMQLEQAKRKAETLKRELALAINEQTERVDRSQLIKQRAESQADAESSQLEDLEDEAQEDERKKEAAEQQAEDDKRSQAEQKAEIISEQQSAALKSSQQLSHKENVLASELQSARKGVVEAEANLKLTAAQWRPKIRAAQETYMRWKSQ